MLRMHLWSRIPREAFLLGILLSSLPSVAAEALIQEASTQELLRRALRLHQEGALSEAIDQYQAFLARRPEAADVHSNLGSAYASTGQYEKAAAAYERALALGTSSDPARVRLSLAWTYLQQARIKKAENVLSALLAEQPENREAALLLATCYQQGDDPARVIQLLSPLQGELANNPEFAYLLGTALLSHGQIERGEELARVVLQGGIRPGAVTCWPWPA